jgi:transposase
MEHYGLISAMCDELGIVEQINRMVGANRRKVSVGHAVKAMVINALGFTARALYLTPRFFDGKLTEVLVGEGIQPSDLNDDSLGTALDVLFESGLNETFFATAAHAITTQGIKHKFAHLDTSTISLHGSYESYYQLEADDITPDEPTGPEVVKITRGFSKDNAPDLNQVVVSLITTYKSSIPLWISAADGNASDKKTFAETINNYRAQLKNSPMPCMVMDSAFYTADNLQAFPDLKWVTRVPETVKDARALIETTPIEAMTELDNGYRIQSAESAYAGVPQRWLVVHSPQARERELATFERNLIKLEKSERDRLAKLQSVEFACEADALAALAQHAKTLKYHDFDCMLAVPEHHYTGKGRPSKSQAPIKTTWRVVAHLIRNQAAIDKACARKGMFIIASNEMDRDQLADAELLSVYKAQGVSVERGFRFLKDPLFYAESLFLNDPKRIMALIMVMGISLLVYSLLERKVRTSLKDQNKTIKSQVGKPTDNPTIRWVFMIFEDVMLAEVQDKGTVTRSFVDPPTDHVVLLECLGHHFKNVYCIN